MRSRCYQLAESITMMFADANGSANTAHGEDVTWQGERGRAGRVGRGLSVADSGKRTGVERTIRASVTVLLIAAATAAAPSAGAVPPADGLTTEESTLLGMLPDPDSCTPSRDPSAAVAAFNCTPASGSDGHQSAYYGLYTDIDQLNSDFTAVTADEQLARCPGADNSSPAQWNRNQAQGSVACGSFQGGADIIWTNTTTLVLADAQGTDLTALHDWWLSTT
jgi:serine/threonine kinase PknH